MKEKDREKQVNWEIILELVVVKDTESDNRNEEQVSKQKLTMRTADCLLMKKLAGPYR